MRVRVLVREQGARGAQAAQLEWPSRRNSCRLRKAVIVHWSSNLAPGTRTTGLAQSEARVFYRISRMNPSSVSSSTYPTSRRTMCPWRSMKMVVGIERIGP